MKILSIVGARPQFVKAGIVSKKLRQEGFDEILVHTGQHYDFNMSDVFFKELEIPSLDYYLGIGSGLHGEQTGKMLIEIEKVLLQEHPDLVLVYGDTNSTLAGALAAVKLHIPVAHVEAGLRSFNKKMPEEINRILTDHISEILFAPTDIAVLNLKKEGIEKNVYKVGDVMLDVVLEVSKKVNSLKVLKKYKLENKNFILVTIHRAENTDIRQNLSNIWRSLDEIAKMGMRIIFPVHPRTRKKLEEYGLLENIEHNLIITEPVSYFEMVALEKSAKLIITDSGGVQKEGYFLGTPCIIPRNETEWVELVDIGFNQLVGTNPEKLISGVLKAWEKSPEAKVNLSLYGEGNASDKIIQILKEFSGSRKK